jgi:hypothetical protein
MSKQEIFLQELRELLDKHNVSSIWGNPDNYGTGEDVLQFSFKNQDTIFTFEPVDREGRSGYKIISTTKPKPLMNFKDIFYLGLTDIGKVTYREGKVDPSLVHRVSKHIQYITGKDITEQEVNSVIREGCYNINKEVL